MLLTRLITVGHSMEPNILQGQTVLVSSIPFLFSRPKSGDIVAFKKEEKIFIKRIARVEGPKYFITGDNKNDSLDSRGLGWVQRQDILGKVIITIA